MKSVFMPVRCGEESQILYPSMWHAMLCLTCKICKVGTERKLRRLPARESDYVSVIVEGEAQATRHYWLCMLETEGQVYLLKRQIAVEKENFVTNIT